MKHLSLLATIIISGLGVAAGAQQAAPAPASPAKAAPLPSFEVVSIKPSPDIMAVAAAGQTPHVGVRQDGAMVDMGFMSPLALICTAYKVQPNQVSGPDWIKTEHFDIQAKMPDGSNKDQMPLMLQSLLLDRFHMVMHRDDKVANVLALEVGKDGAKLQPPQQDAPASAAPLGPNERMVDDGQGGQMRVKTTGAGGQGANANSKTEISGGPNGPMTVETENGVMHLHIGRMTMDQLSQQIGTYIQQPVVNKTGLEGQFQIQLDMSMADIIALARSYGVNMPNAASSGDASEVAADPSGNTVYQSVAAMGLKLQHEKLPWDHIIVDSIDKTPITN